MELVLGERIEEVAFEVIEHLPENSWVPIKKQQMEIPSIVYAENLIMSEFIPLAI